MEILNFTAITEGRGLARGEVGIAAVDAKRPHLILCQISDTQTYANTLRKINILNPAEVREFLLNILQYFVNIIFFIVVFSRFYYQVPSAMRSIHPNCTK